MIYRHGIKPLVLLVVFWGLTSSGISAADMVHLVAKGETIYSISRLYKISQEELMRHNNIADASKLRLGMRLAIPSGINVSPAVTVAPVSDEYIVSKNDTLYSIARSRGITLQALRDANGFPKNYVLKTGEKIKIPDASAVTATIKTIPSLPPVQATARKVDSSIRWPVTAKEILYMNSNAGVLVSGSISESIKSLTGGTVVHASPWRGYGNVAVIEAEGGYRYLYGSCESLSVKKGDTIEPGTELGKLGIYPASGKPDLVLIVSKNGSPVDPAKAPRS